MMWPSEVRKYCRPEDAGVTERTFFRYFTSKSDVLVANWELHGDALRAALITREETELIEVIRAALLAFAERLAINIESRIESAISIYADRAAFLAIVASVLALEQDLAEEIGRRTSRSSKDLHVRIVANASLGVLRASVRAFVQDPQRSRLSEAINSGVQRLGGLYEALEAGDQATWQALTLPATQQHDP
jgi:AcrR family transcriptional regulator